MHGNPNGAGLGDLDTKDVSKQPINLEAKLTSPEPFERFLG